MAHLVADAQIGPREDGSPCLLRVDPRDNAEVDPEPQEFRIRKRLVLLCDLVEAEPLGVARAVGIFVKYFAEEVPARQRGRW